MSDRTACKAREGGGPSDVHVVFPYADLQEQRHEDIYQHGVTARTATPQRASRSSRSATTAIQGQEPRVVEAIRRIVHHQNVVVVVVIVIGAVRVAVVVVAIVPTASTLCEQSGEAVEAHE